jgi:UDP:flavonoid glycosyltransferase YjiC (YdhE family)
MRLLVACQPVRSHLHSLLPVALAAERLGHTVGVATGPRLEPLVRRLGLDFLPCGLDFDPATTPIETFAADPGLADAPLPVRQLVGFTRLAPAFVRDLLERGAAWRPEVLLREPLEFGSPIAAARWELRHASVLWAIAIDPRYLMRDAYTQVCRAFGVDVDALIDGFDRHLVLRALPPAWRIDRAPSSTLAVRMPPFDAVGDEPVPGGRPLARPTLYVTLGLSFSQAPRLFRRILDGLDGLDVTALVTVGLDLDPARLRRVPANVRVERYIPGSLVLPRCDAVVFHGGFNTLHQALWHGLPLVVIPRAGGDQLPTAEQVAALGLGVALPQATPSASAIRDAIEHVLGDASYTRTARRLRAEMRALPPLDDAVARLESLGRHPPLADARAG